MSHYNISLLLMIKKPILKALHGKKLAPPPVWIMRQAGRYLPEYRKIRKKFDFLTLCFQPELICEVTLQPLKRFALDAAILFSDILIPLIPMGMKLRFDNNQGPVFENPVQNRRDINRLKETPGEECGFVGQALKLIQKELPENAALLGFCGAPFTLASYMVEGAASNKFLKIKAMIHRQPQAYAALMEKLVKATISYLNMQMDNGAEAIQIFDSWAGRLAPKDYKEFAHPYSRRIIDYVEGKNVPVIHFAKGGVKILPVLNQSKASGIGISWEVSMQQAAGQIEPAKCLQGNLNPAVLLECRDTVAVHTEKILQTMSSLPHPHIFNLGHGILPETPIENVRVMLDTVRNFKSDL